MGSPSKASRLKPRRLKFNLTLTTSPKMNWRPSPLMKKMIFFSIVKLVIFYNLSYLIFHNSNEEEAKVEPKRMVFHTDDPNTVIGFGADYDLITYKHFVGSLRSTGFKGNIILGLGNYDNIESGWSKKYTQKDRNKIEKYLQKQNVSIKMIDIRPCREKGRLCIDGLRHDWKLSSASYFLAKQWLKECEFCQQGQVLLTSIPNTYFVHAPFQDSKRKEISSNHIQLNFYEFGSLGMQDWRVESLRKCKGFDWDVNLISANIVNGDAMSILFFLTSMISEMHQWQFGTSKLQRECSKSTGRDETSILNYLFYNGDIRATLHDTSTDYVWLASSESTIDNSLAKESTIIVAQDLNQEQFITLLSRQSNYNQVVGSTKENDQMESGFISPLQTMAMQ
ncbi:hypothetical protein CTEN210_03765 [Chaetoceros tenuissimus]|uniref:Uncharacterized protein n=1 Tax=Chaetoceros tenuissimus TaxID=426638 RepID=A0AAD3CLK2_9STRA|nr:hypothetical protein CTEN210_03765 [Chaetoceros tenuissimus]